MKPPIPANEAERLQALHRYNILDTLPERDFDDLTLLASHICHTPIALISLVDSDRQWFKSRVGLDVAETSRDASFCAHAIAADTLLVVPDATKDKRFADNVLVTGDPRVRFYAGTLLKTPEGQNIGTLCIIDRTPRELTEAEAEALQALGRQVVNQLELHRTVEEMSQTMAAKEEAERALRESEEKYRSIFESANDLIMSITPGGRFLYTNPAWKETLGYSDDELADKTILDLLHPACVEKFRKTCLEGEARNIHGLEAIFLTRAGRPLDVEGDITRHFETQGMVWVQGIFRDVTERKMVEKLKSEFVSTVSHELRTPLTAILGSLGLIAGGVAGPVSEQTGAMVQVAHKNSERLVRLINDILDIDKIESGKMTFDLRPSPLLPLLLDSIEANRAYAQRLGVSLSFVNALPPALSERLELPALPDQQAGQQAQPEQPHELQVRVDPDRFLQVMANLLSNAAKFSPAGQNVEVKVELSSDSADSDTPNTPDAPNDSDTALSQLKAQPLKAQPSPQPSSQPWVRVSVRDNGSGVPPEFHDRIFQKFAQADSSDTRQKGGTGLGLSISKAIIETFGGAIGFKSSCGEGTVFYFTLPVYEI